MLPLHRIFRTGLTLLAILTASTAFAKGPTVIVVGLTGKVQVENTTGFPFDLRLDGQFMGRVEAFTDVILEGVPAGNHMLISQFPGAAQVPGQHIKFHVAPKEMKWVQLTVPNAKLAVRNPNPFPTTVFVDGVARKTLKPYGKATLFGIEPGNRLLEIRGQGLAQSVSMFLTPGKRSQWKPVAWTGAVRVTNPNPKTLYVKANGVKLGSIAPGHTRVFSGLIPGMTDFTFVTKGMVKTKTKKSLVVPAGSLAAIAAPEIFIGGHHHSPKKVIVKKHYGSKGHGKGKKGKKSITLYPHQTKVVYASY